MTKGHRETNPTTALSPYLSLRESVRPAIFAYNLLAKEQGQARILAAEINSLLKATEDLLEAAGLFHMLSPGPLGDAVPAGDGSGGQKHLIRAYSDAGMQWARIVGSCLSLADALLAAALWDDALRLADYVSAAGEPGAAADIRARIGAAQRKAEADAFRARASHFLRHFGGGIPASEIHTGISIWRDASAYPSVKLEIEKELYRLLLESIVEYQFDVQGRAPRPGGQKRPLFISSQEKSNQVNSWLNRPDAFESLVSSFEGLYKYWH